MNIDLHEMALTWQRGNICSGLSIMMISPNAITNSIDDMLYPLTPQHMVDDDIFFDKKILHMKIDIRNLTNV